MNAHMITCDFFLIYHYIQQIKIRLPEIRHWNNWLECSIYVEKRIFVDITFVRVDIYLGYLDERDKSNLG